MGRNLHQTKVLRLKIPMPRIQTQKGIPVKKGGMQRMQERQSVNCLNDTGELKTWNYSMKITDNS